MNVLIIGAGAIGCLVGGKLAQTNHEVTLVGRSRFVAAVRSTGLSLSDDSGTHTVTDFYPVASIAEAFSYMEDNFDLAILTVKSYDTVGAISELTAALQQHGHNAPAILSLQNGVGNEEAIAHQFGADQVIAGSITTPVTTLGPGEIRVDKPNYDIGISPWSDARLHSSGTPQMIISVQRSLDCAGFSSVLFPDPQGLKWTKLLMNMVGNASSAILNMPPDKIFADDALVNLEIEAWREALRVMHAAEIAPVDLGSYSFTKLAPLIRYLPKLILRGPLRNRIGSARGGKMPSLHIDLHRGREESEVKWLNGAVVMKGEELGIDTPINRMYTDTLLALIGNPALQASWSGNRTLFLTTAKAYRTGNV